MSRDAAIAETRAWLARAVIGLNLCPFAKAPFAKSQIRYVASDAKDPQTLLAHLVDELKLLVDAPEANIETTLLIHPEVLGDFTDYNEFLGTAEGALEMLGLEGVIQVASFHPQYCFAGSRPDDIDNATNRSPYPTLHLLREASVERAVDAFPDAGAIFEANIATMQRLGAEGWAALQQQCRTDAAPKGTSHS
ncbi:MAG: DUF1415 domain-containing protein [Caldimonas sp.]|nr:DUF1415 domain-containing protein [Pseudomonadota bacterium]